MAENDSPYLYLPEMQQPSYRSDMTLFVRTTQEAARLVPALKAEIRILDANLPLFDVRTMAQVVRQSLAGMRMGRTLLAGFGVLAMLLAMIGLYGVMAYRVNRRSQEVGVRMALGARAPDVLVLFLREGARLASMGIGVGLLLAGAAARVLQSALLGVAAMDLLTFAAVAGLLGTVALLASYLPARRAARVNPMVALRAE
jgi:ABC-type antimicrobial peptide transport system permease subunit